MKKENFKNIQRSFFVQEFYDKKDIQSFISEITNLNFVTKSNIIDKEYEKFISLCIERLGILEYLMRTKKISNNKKDFIEVGKFLQFMGKEMEQYGFKHKNDNIEQLEDDERKNQKNTSENINWKEEFKKDISELIEMILEDE